MNGLDDLNKPPRTQLEIANEIIDTQHKLIELLKTDVTNRDVVIQQQNQLCQALKQRIELTDAWIASLRQGRV